MQIGWSEIDITPNERIKLAGQFYERVSEGIHSRISIVAMALSTEYDQVVFCACDLACIYPNLMDLVRRNLIGPWRSGNGPDYKKVIVSATHTHNSYLYKSTSLYALPDNILGRYLPPSMKYLPKVTADGVLPESDALYFLADKISEAILDAWANRKEGYVMNAFGRAAVGMCKRVVYNDGRAKTLGETNISDFESLESGNDSGIELLFTFNDKKRCTGVVANVACPAQVMEHNSVISADYWGAVREFVRKRFGVKFKVLGLCGAAGDQYPKDLIRQTERVMTIGDSRDLQLRYDSNCCRIAGKRIANEIISAAEELYDENGSLKYIMSDTTIIHRVNAVKLPVRRVSSKEYEDAVEVLREYIECFEKDGTYTYEDNADMHSYAGIIARYEYQQTMELYPVEMHTVRLGDVAFVTNGFELFLDYGNKIRARSPAKQTFISQLSCSSDGYLPTEKAEKGGHYSAYVSSGIVGHEGGDLLVRHTLEELRLLF